MTDAPRRRLVLDDPLGPADASGPDHRSQSHGGVSRIELDLITRNPHQPRQRFDPDRLEALADSIRERGVLQPIIVTPVDGGRFTLVAGERRWRAARLAGLTEIPALIDHQLDGAASLQVALIENVVREDLSPIEQARTIASLLDDLGVKTEALAKQLGKSRSDLAHTVRLLELPDDTIGLIDTGQLTKGHGKVLLTEPDHAQRRVLARKAVTEGWSVRTLADAIAQAKHPPRPQRESRAHPDVVAAAERLGSALTHAMGIETDPRPHRRGIQIFLDTTAAARLEELLRTAGDRQVRPASSAATDSLTQRQ